MIRSIIFSLFFVGCMGVQRPDTNIYVVNAPAKHLKGYNMRSDYDANGVLLPNAVPIILPISTIDDVNKYNCTDPDGFANLKIYIEQLRDYYSKNCQTQ